MNPIKARESVPMNVIVQHAVYELNMGIAEHKRGNGDDALRHYHRAESVFVFFNMEHNAITLNLSLNIAPKTERLIRQALSLHTELHALIIAGIDKQGDSV